MYSNNLYPYPHLQGVNIFQIHLDDFIWKRFDVCRKEGCKWCKIQETVDVTNLDESMNGRALQKEFGGFSAKAIFKKMGWELADQTPAATPASEQGKTTGFANKTSELVEKWKTNAAKKSRRLNEDERLLEKQERKKKKMENASDPKE